LTPTDADRPLTEFFAGPCLTMPSTSIPNLSLAIDRLRAGSSHHFVVHVIQVPYPGGYVIADCLWDDSMNQLWQAWQEMFSARELPMVPYVSDFVSDLTGAKPLDRVGLAGTPMVYEPIGSVPLAPPPDLPAVAAVVWACGSGCLILFCRTP
jgi:hypothetical protein